MTGWDPSTGVTTFGGKLGSSGFQSKCSQSISFHAFLQINMYRVSGSYQTAILIVQTLLLETCCSHAPHPRDPPIQAALQAHQAAQAQHQKLLLVRTATPLMVVDASFPSSLTGRSTTAAQWTILVLEKLLGVPPR